MTIEQSFDMNEINARKKTYLSTCHTWKTWCTVPNSNTDRSCTVTLFLVFEQMKGCAMIKNLRHYLILWTFHMKTLYFSLMCTKNLIVCSFRYFIAIFIFIWPTMMTYWTIIRERFITVIDFAALWFDCTFWTGWKCP